MELLSVILVVLTVISVLIIDQSKAPAIRKVLNWIPAILFAYIIPAIVTHCFSLDLSSVKLHSFSKNFIMPLAIVVLMSALSFRQLKSVGLRPILVFVSGSFAIATLPLLLLGLFSLFTDVFYNSIIGEDYWQGMVTIVGSWIGGSTSQLILKEISGCSESVFLVILVMDNVLINIWTILMFQKIKKSEAINNRLKINDTKIDFIPDEILITDDFNKNILLTVSICLLLVILSYFFVEQFLNKIIVLSIVGLVLGNSFKFWNHSFMIKCGGYLIISIMAILGLKLNFSNFSLPASIIIFSIIWLILHYVVMMVVAYLCKLNFAWVPIASMANVGGISTAPAVTKAYNEEWMPHAILLSILSMVTGTYWGMLAIYLFRTFY